MSKLVIVESPAKVKKLAAILGDGWVVEATRGAVRDLPEKELGIDIDHHFQPQFGIAKDKRGVVSRLKRAIKKADVVYIATDPDREGETIGWHILDLAQAEASGKPVYRVTLSALTRHAVQAAFETPRPIDRNLVEAQHTRRVVDRLVGYLVSPLACKVLDSRVSIGRLRSVCLRLVVDREREIAAFVPVTAWSLSIKLRAAGGEFTAQLTGVLGQKPPLKEGEQAEQLRQGLTGANFWVGETRQAEKAWPPPPPFSTSTLQQAASKALGLAPEHTMTIAQMLYEAGFITYGCTDSVEVAPEAQAEARQFIAQSYGQAYLPAQPPVYQTKPNEGMETYAAIRPTDVTRLPDSLPPGDGTALYRLIWQRFVASQMAPARYHHSAARILAGKAAGQPYPLEFQARGRTLTFDGFRRVYDDVSDEGEERQPDRMLPPLSDGEQLAVIDWTPEEHTSASRQPAIPKQRSSRHSRRAASDDHRPMHRRSSCSKTKPTCAWKTSGWRPPKLESS